MLRDGVYRPGPPRQTDAARSGVGYSVEIQSGVTGSVMEAYCLKCRAKREMQDEKQITMKNGKPATEGKCPECGTRMFKIGGGAKAEGAAGSSDTATKTAAKPATRSAAKSATKDDAKPAAKTSSRAKK